MAKFRDAAIQRRRSSVPNSLSERLGRETRTFLAREPRPIADGLAFADLKSNIYLISTEVSCVLTQGVYTH